METRDQACPARAREVGRVLASTGSGQTDDTTNPIDPAARARRTLAAVAEVVTTRIPYDGGTAATAAVVALCQLYLRDLPSDERQEVLELAKQVEVE